MRLEKILMYFIKALIILFMGTFLIVNCAIPKDGNKLISLIPIIIFGTAILLLEFLKRKKKIEFKKVKEISKKKFLLAAFIIFLLTILYQIFLIRYYYFITGWDVYNVFYFGKNYVSTPDLFALSDDGMYTYLSVYPNNLFLCRLFCLIGVITKAQNLYKVLMFINIFIVDLTAIVLLRIMNNYKVGRNSKLLGLLFYMVLIGISPWILVPYTDTLVIIIPALILYNYSKEKKRGINYVIIGLALVLGYLLKPTTVIIGIAIAILELIKLIDKLINKEFNKEIFKKYLYVIIMIIIGVGIGIISNARLEKQIPYDVDENHSMTIYHYLMMGLNKETDGGFNHGDFWGSIDHYGVEEKKEYNISTWKQRVKEVDFNFLSRKLAYNYNDGTFAWEGEGEFYFGGFEIRDQKTYEKLASFYQKEGDKYYIFSNIYQVIWIMLLLTCFISIIRNKINEKSTLLYLTIIGHTLFLMIFEARARYLIIYLPVFITIASCAFNYLRKEENK